MENNQNEINDKLLSVMKEKPIVCPHCNHVFNEEEHRHLISDAEDNQNCPKCKSLIT